MTLPRVCSACFGPLINSPIFESAYAHTPSCRIGKRVTITRQLAEFRELMDRSSFGTPGARAVAEIGHLCLKGMSYEEACAEVGPEKTALANEETDRLILDLDKMRSGR